MKKYGNEEADQTEAAVGCFGRKLEGKLTTYTYFKSRSVRLGVSAVSQGRVVKTESNIAPSTGARLNCTNSEDPGGRTLPLKPGALRKDVTLGQIFNNVHLSKDGYKHS